MNITFLLGDLLNDLGGLGFHCYFCPSDGRIGTIIFRLAGRRRAGTTTIGTGIIAMMFLLAMLPDLRPNSFEVRLVHAGPRQNSLPHMLFLLCKFLNPPDILSFFHCLLDCGHSIALDNIDGYRHATWVSRCFSVDRGDAGDGRAGFVVMLRFDCRRRTSFSVATSCHDERRGNNGRHFIVINTLHSNCRKWNHNGHRQVDDPAHNVPPFRSSGGFCFRFGAVAIGGE
mmetsp:Transcript_28665/g.83041  ORF Transcript_28665/g.83041 Transcript_28665/m.83041 type:complete len:228 (+) Transcript_28665:784-1467(+)